MIVSREIIIENYTLLHGDAIALLPSLQADLIVTDPPYRLTSGGKVKGGMHERLGSWREKTYQNDGEIVPCDIEWPDFMPLLYASLAPQAHCYVMSNNRHVGNMLAAASACGFEFHNLLVWDKITATPNRWYMKNCEFTGFFYKGNARMINDCSAKQLISCPQVDATDHPTEKPVALMRHYIEQSTKRGDIVLDPFMGSGTTGVAALQAGRRFIGIEKDERFFKMAERRIKSAVDNHMERLI